MVAEVPGVQLAGDALGWVSGEGLIHELRVGGSVGGNVGQVNASFLQQFPDGFLGLDVGSLAAAGVPDRPLLVDEELGGPGVVAVGVPGGEEVVEGDGVLQPVGTGGFFDVGQGFLELELRGVDADGGQSVAVVLVVPGLQVGQGSDAVDAGVGPEVEENDAPPLFLDGCAGGVDPSGDTAELGRRSGSAGIGTPTQQDGEQEDGGQLDQLHNYKYTAGRANGLSPVA